MAIMSIERKIQAAHLTAIAGFLKPHNEMAARVQAAQSLATVGPKAANKTTVKALADALTDKEPAVVYWAMFALASFGKEAKAAIPALRAIVDDPNQPEAVRKLAEQTIDIIQEKGKKEKSKDKVAPK